MSLLQEIQESVIQKDTQLGPVFLKLRLLASRLGSPELEEWVKFESDGYPADSPLPFYRKLSVDYKGTFLGPLDSGIRNAPIPPSIIEKIAGKQWTNYEIRQSIAAIDELIESTSDGSGSLQINAADLILLLQGKIYKGYACNDIQGAVSRASLVELQHAVKSRVLELTIELEKSIPAARDVTFGTQQLSNSKTSAEVSQISHQVIYGNVTSITSNGDDAKIILEIDKGDVNSFKDSLIRAGLKQTDAADLAKIVASEESGDKNEPLGTKAKAWLVDNLKKATDGTWKVGISVATEIIKKAALKFYGLE